MGGSHSNPRPMLLSAYASLLCISLYEVADGSSNTALLASSTPSPQRPAVSESQSSSLIGFVILLSILLLAVVAIVTICCVTGMWRRRHMPSRTGPNNADNFTQPARPSTVSVRRHQSPSNVYAVASSHKRNNSLSNPNRVLLTPTLTLPPQAYQSASSDSAHVQYASTAIQIDTQPAHIPSSLLDVKRSSRDTPV